MVVIVKKKMSLLLLMRVLVRSLFIQSGWNFKKMQNLGFAFSIIPALKRIYGDKSEELQAAVKRHLIFYNSHPYLSAPILGATISLEEEYKLTGAGMENINIFKNSMMGICGGVGDTFFWGVARPVAGLLGVILALTAYNIYAPVACLVLYNIVHLTFRAATFFSSYKNGTAVTKTIMKINLRTQTQRLKKLEIVLLGALLALIKNKFVICNFDVVTYNFIAILLFILIFFILYFLINKNISPALIVYIAVTAVILISYIYNSSLA